MSLIIELLLRSNIRENGEKQTAVGIKLAPGLAKKKGLSVYGEED